MCNFVLPGEKKLPGDRRPNRIYHHAGEEPYTKREKEFEDSDGESGK